MNIICAISTRGRPMSLAGTLFSLQTLESGKHQIKYVVRVESSDHDTMDVAQHYLSAPNVDIMYAKSHVTLGQCWNECVADREWDACAVIADKHLCLTQNWDEGIANVIGGEGRPAARWNLIRNPLETALILSRKWYDTTGEIFPEWFPFWFSERWVVEVHQLAFTTGIPIIQDMLLTEPVGKTQGLRDLEFWFDFFAQSRVLRIAEARKIATAFGRIMPDVMPIIAEMRRADEWQKPRIPSYYETRGAPIGEPSPQYIEAKRRAQGWLAHKETVHAA